MVVVLGKRLVRLRGEFFGFAVVLLSFMPSVVPRGQVEMQKASQLISRAFT